MGSEDQFQNIIFVKVHKGRTRRKKIHTEGNVMERVFRPSEFLEAPSNIAIEAHLAIHVLLNPGYSLGSAGPIPHHFQKDCGRPPCIRHDLIHCIPSRLIGLQQIQVPVHISMKMRYLGLPERGYQDQKDSDV